MNSRQVLQVDYNQQQGLMLGWRYTDLNTYLTFFRHVIVISSYDKEKVRTFLKTYLKKMRPGDLYTILYYNEECKLKFKGWRQKINGEQTQDFNDIIKGDIMTGDKQKMMAKVEQQFRTFSDPIVVSVYIEDVQQKNWFETRILQQRSNQNYDFIVGLFGPFTWANLSFANQVNIIPFTKNQASEAVNFYLSNVYQSAVLWARVSIQCLNASVTSSSEKNWSNVHFNTVERTYRGPSIKYDKDYLHFYGSKGKEAKYNMLLKLTYVTLQRRKFVSEKKFSVHSFGGFNKLTFSISHWNKPYHACGDIWLYDNPYRSLTILKFERQSPDQI